MWCQCEHISHFDNGKNHKYGIECDKVTVFNTIYGRYDMCDDCIKDHPLSEKDLKGDKPSRVRETKCTSSD